MSLAYAEGPLTQLRRELKLILTHSRAELLLARLCEELGEPTVCPTRIRSVYFDGPGLPLARRALRTPGDCLKVRTKEYSPDLLAPEGGRVVVEIKRERAGATRKRRRWVALERLLAKDARALGVLGRIASGRLRPVVGTTYTRTVYQPSERWRITLDRDLRFFVPHGLNGEADGLEDPRVIAEIKIGQGPLPLWIAALAAEGGHRFSKFGSALTRLHRLDCAAGR